MEVVIKKTETSNISNVLTKNKINKKNIILTWCNYYKKPKENKNKSKKKNEPQITINLPQK